MVNALSELVHFIGEEVELVSRFKHAVEWVASKPEGIAILKEAYELHGKPLEIITVSTVHNLGYADNIGNHVVFANPLVSDNTYLRGQNGERIQLSLERFFCHEFKHCAQPGLLAYLQQYMARRAEILTTCLPSIPFERYLTQFATTKNHNSALKKIFGKFTIPI